MKSLIRNTVLLVALSVGFGIAMAQQPETTSATSGAPQSQSEPQKPEGAAQPASVENKTEEQKPAAEASSEKQEGVGKEEEEQEENAQLKYSPTVTKLGKMVGLDPKASYWLFTGLNFAVVIGII